MRTTTGAVVRAITWWCLLVAASGLGFPVFVGIAQGQCAFVDAVGIEVACTGLGEMSGDVPGNYVGTGQHWYWADSSAVFFNAGSVNSEMTALEIRAPRVTYTGSAAAQLESQLGSGLFVDARAPFGKESEVAVAVDLEVSHDIVAAKGLSVLALPGADPRVQIRILDGVILASEAGIEVDNQTTAPTELAIGARAVIKAPVGIWFSGDTSGSHVVLAGGIVERVAGEGQASSLTVDDDILELHPTYALAGTIDGRTGNNELRLGGTGTRTFDLGDIGWFDDQGDAHGSFLNFSSFTKTGSSTWTLKGSTDLALGMDVRSGTIALDDVVLGGDVTVWNGAALKGTGRVGDVEVFGTLAPGSLSGGTLIAADVTFHPGSIFEIDVGAYGFDLLQAERVEAAGSTLRVVPSSATAGSYDVIHSATSIVGEFKVISNSPRYSVALSTSVDGTILSLDLERTGVPFSSYARTPDQAAVAALLDAMGKTAPYYAQLDGMNPLAAAELMGQMAGSGFAATSGALLQQSTSLSSASLGRIQQQAGALGPSGGPLGHTAFSTDVWHEGLDPTAWGKLIAGTSTIGGSLAGSTALVGGVDVALGDDWTLGLLAALGSSAIAAGNASTSSTDFSAGFYGAGEWGSLALRFGGSLTHHGVDAKRRVAAPGVDETLVASYGALTAQLFAELAHEFDFGPLDFELFGDLAYARHFSPGFTETGGAGALTVAASSSDAVDTTLGARVTHQAALGTRLLTLGATIGWKHRFTAVPTTYNSFAGAAPFPVAGISTAGSALVAGANLRLDLDEWTGLDLAYTFEWGATGLANSISAKYARRF